jgi:phosphoglycerate dehydrogenase-like enzyme
MARPRLHILSQVDDPDVIDLPPDLRAQVEITFVPPSRPIPQGLIGDVLIASFGNDACYELAERGVKWVHYLGTGIDRLDAARLGRARVLTNSRGVAAIPISEWVLAVLLHHEKQLAETFIRQRPSSWPVRTPLGTLHGRRIALLGLGSIGAAVAARALPFGSELRALRKSNAASPVAGVTMVSSLGQLLEGADHLVLAAPLTEATRHILDAKALATVKPGLHIVNVARGGLIDQDALHAALDSGAVSAASLDAVTPEPLPEGHWLYTHPRVRLSPHISWSWPASRKMVGGVFAANLRRYLGDQPIENVIELARGY